MKKKLLAAVLSVMMVGSLVACGGNSGNQTADDSDKQQDEKMVYAVEAGSAGEEAAEEKGFESVPVASQADALMEVASGTSDAAIIDLLMAGAMIGENTSYPDLVYTDKLTTEEYGVGCRKGSDLKDFINSVFSEAYEDGSLKEIATKYGVQESLVEQPKATEFTQASGGDVEYIKGKGSLVVGITDFAPMDYKDGNGEWIGFDAEMAKITAEKLGVAVEFIEIDWDNKVMELDSKKIDVVWNGMTLTEEVTKAMDCSNPYCNNAQVVVVPAAQK